MHYNWKRPKAITMWDFSWLERRWPGAGFENWEQRLDELLDRGYDAVRIDVYPHLISANPHGGWMLKPTWNQQTWGAPALTRVEDIAANLLRFLALCRERGIAVGLSTWFREDRVNVRMSIATPEQLAQCWIDILRLIDDAGYLDTVLYVDLCNEFPHDCWIPFLKQDSQYQQMLRSGACMETKNLSRTSEVAKRWTRSAVSILRQAYPNLDYTFSQCGEYESLEEQATDSLDFLEPHIWFTSFSDYYRRVGYHFERFETTGYDNLALYGEKVYREQAELWDGKLCEGIQRVAAAARKNNMPLITTECWGVVDYKDWPLLSWDWVKHLCEVGVKTAVAEGQWLAIATSNFCAPQFVGMWSDVEWHRQLTSLIKNGRLPETTA